MTGSARVFLLLLLCVEAAVLAVLETMFLPLRFDGTLLPKLGDFPFPIMIVVAAVTTPVLVSWAAELSERVVTAALPLIVWFLTLNLSSEALNGTWKLRVNDAYTYDTGYINSWSVTF